MRRFWAVALVIGSSIGLAACGGGTPEDAAGQPAANTVASTVTPSLDQRLAAITAAQAELVTIFQQRTDSSAGVLTAIADLNTRLDAIQREVNALAADTAATNNRTSTTLNDLAAGLRDARGAVDALSRALPPANSLTGLAANLNGLGTNVATLVGAVNAVATDVGNLGPRIDALEARQAEQAPLLAAAAAGDPAVAELAAAFAAYQEHAVTTGGTLDELQQQALAASLAALNAQLAALGVPTGAAPATATAPQTTAPPAAPAGATPAPAAAPAAAPATAAAATPVAAAAPAPSAPVRAGAFAAAPQTAANGATAATALPDGRLLIETVVNGANLTMSERAFDLVTGTTYVWRITAGADYPMRLLLPRFTDFAYVASITVDGAVFEYPPLQEVDILEESVIEIEFTPIRTRVMTFEFLPQFGAVFTDMNMVGTLTFR